MRIFEAAKSPTNLKADVEHVIERALHSSSGSPRHVEVEMILHRLGGAGYVIAHKDDMPAREPKLGTVALLTDEGERVVKAVAKGDFTTISDRDFRLFTHLVDEVLEGDRLTARMRELDKLVVGYAERPITPEDFTGLKREPGRADEAPAGHMVADDLGAPTGRSFLVTTRDASGREHHFVHREYAKFAQAPSESVHLGHTRGLDVPQRKAVRVSIAIGGETLQAVANVDDIEALRRALPRLTTPVVDTL